VEALGIGIGINSGIVRFGEFGRSHRDLTAIGTVVNTAARVFYGNLRGSAVPSQGPGGASRTLRRVVGVAKRSSTAPP
jgi:hypothetical protein